MTRRVKAERTARLLQARLEALGHVAERSPLTDRALAAELARTEVVTQRAVELRLLTEPQAKEIWARSQARHPRLLPPA
jgi:DNA-binding winged helix-turn-helix (wHTH) protein